MIEKNLHHIWLGSEYPSQKLVQCLIQALDLHPSWVPHYWKNIDALWECQSARDRRAQIEEHFGRMDQLVQIESRRNAFKADIMRTCLLHEYGGVYLDHDMFCVKPLDDLLDEDCLMMQFREGKVGEGIMGFRKGDERLLKILDHVLADSPVRVIGLQLGALSRHNGWKTFPPEYFCPHPRMNIEDGDKYKWTDKTYTIHLWREYEYDMATLRNISSMARSLECLQT